MSISIAQYVDLLVKKLDGVAKTDTAANKSPSNESIVSPALNRGDTLWTESNIIPATAATTAGIVEAYTGASAVQTTADTTTVPVSGVYPTWLTGLTNWIPPEFGSTYFVQAWVNNPGVGNPTIGGTQIFDSGSGGTGEWFFDYQAGLLNFIGQTIPASLTTGKVIYIIGYRYVGKVGVQNLGNITIGNITALGSLESTGNIVVGNILTDGYYYANGTPFAGGGGGNVSTGNVTFDNNIVIGTGDGFGGAGLYLAVGPSTVADGQLLRLRGGDVATHIHLDTGNNAYYDQYFGDDNKYLKLVAGDNSNVVIGTNALAWTFSNTGTTVLPSIVTSPGVGEAQVFVGTRTIVGGLTVDVPYSTVLAAGGTPTVAYLSSPGVASTKITFAVQSSGSGFQFEQFDVVATASQDVGGAVNYVVSNRVKGAAGIGDTVVTATMNGSQIEISLILDAVQTSGGVSSFNAVEFALMID